ncbi:MAG TPA: zinc ribbon domain-containing protein [Desulfobacterales bacterium]|nr:zinc ribbon domain-containing protein [Desulfobacterales bacterium]
MKCPKCQHENPDEAVFCGSCGAKLSLVCPQCGAENPPMNKFCMKCGLNLTIPSEPAIKDLSLDEKLEKIQKYLPKGITEKILAQRDRIEGERKQVTGTQQGRILINNSLMRYVGSLLSACLCFSILPFVFPFDLLYNSLGLQFTN